jgi:hypothetical protein
MKWEEPMVVKGQRVDEKTAPVRKQSIWDESPETSEPARRGRKMADRLLKDLQSRLFDARVHGKAAAGG